MHLSVDTKSELSMAIEVTPAHVNDGDVAPELIQQIAEYTKADIHYLLIDGGYDQLKYYESAKKIGAQAIITLNLRNEKEPPIGIASNGTPRCSMGYEMTYWGAEKNQLKFRCPHATGKVDCALGMASCSSYNYGMVVKVSTYKDLRRYSNPPRDSKH
jgi:transposase, IS5 family